MFAKLLRLTRAGSPGLDNGMPEVTMETATVRVLFVCMGNLCRSPVAEGVFRHLLHQYQIDDKVLVDSAGTHAYHDGSPPDRRMQEAARRRGVELARLRARRVEPEDFEHFDYIIAMDDDNYRHLVDLCPDPAWNDRIRLFMTYAPSLPEREVPDPYYGMLSGFERVIDLVEEAAQGLVLHIRRQHSL